MSENLTARQKKALVALVSEPTVMRASETSGIARVTMYTYLSDPAFQQALARQQDEILSLVASKAANLVGRSLEVLEEALDDDKTKFRAASVALRHVTELLSYLDLSRRMVTLEDKIETVRIEKQN
jgi:hypothetical protein|tara:strand:- start:2324 stop:2701 length:378 start_codon:yes stop_codon:yes gene_type:complete